MKNLGADFPKSVRTLWYRGKESFVRDEIRCVHWQEGLKELFEIESLITASESSIKYTEKSTDRV